MYLLWLLRQEERARKKHLQLMKRETEERRRAEYQLVQKQQVSRSKQEEIRKQGCTLMQYYCAL